MIEKDRFYCNSWNKRGTDKIKEIEAFFKNQWPCTTT